MPTYVGVSDTPYTYEDGVVCAGDVAELSDDQAARGIASGQIVASEVVAPEIAPDLTVPDTENEEV